MRLFKTILLLTVLLWSTLLIGQTELVNQRTVYSKTFHLQGAQYKTVLSTMPLYYRGTDGQLREISEPAMQFLNQGRTPENGLMRTTSTSELSPSASGSYGEVDYTYPSVDAYYDEENMEWIYDTTYTDTTGYLTMSDAWTVTGQYYDDDMLYQLTSQSPGEVSEVDSIMNWRSLLSWNPSSLDIFSDQVLKSV